MDLIPSLLIYSIYHFVATTDKEDNGIKYVPLLDMKTMTRKMAWNIVLLCGGGMAIANGCEV